MESTKDSETLHIKVNPIVFQGIPASSKDSPRCMLRIPDSAQAHLLVVPGTKLPTVNKTKSATVSPMGLSPAVSSNVNEGFPDIIIRHGQKVEGEDRKTDYGKERCNSRTMRKYNSDKRLKSNNLELPPLAHAIVRQSAEALHKDERVFEFDN